MARTLLTENRRVQYQPSRYLNFNCSTTAHLVTGSTNILPDATASASIFVWVYLTGFGAGSTDLIRDIIGNKSDGSTKGWIFKISKTAKDRLEFSFYTAGGALRSWISNVQVPYSRWGHVGVVFNGTNTTFYIDGNPDVKEDIPVQTISEYTVQNIRIGHRQAAGSTFEHFGGNMSDLCVWNRALTQYEISALYKTRTVPVSGLRARWTMDDTGSTVTDLIGGYNATLATGVTFQTTVLDVNRSAAATRLAAGVRTAV